MKYKKENTCCFFGHREIAITEDIKENLRCEIEKLIAEKSIYIFLFGSRSRFDTLCYETISALKEKYPHILRIYVRAEFPFIGEKYTKYLQKKYEDTYYPDEILKAGKASYIERNMNMIDNSRFCICYYNPNYVPLRKSNNVAHAPNSGTEISYRYGIKKQKEIINIFETGKGN